MSNLFQKIVIFILLFLLVVRPEFVFIPLGINRFFGILGILVYISDISTRKKILLETKAYLKPIIVLLIPIILVSICTCLINSTSDFYFVRYAISMILGYFSMYLFAYLVYKTYGKLELKILMGYMVAVCLFYVVIALLCFYAPSLYYYLTSIQRIEEGAENAMNRTEGTRMIGIGANFFTSALINGTILISIALFYIAYNNKLLQRTLLLVSFSIIGILGMMMARTTVFGLIIGVVILIIGSFNRVGAFFKSIIPISMLGIVLILLYNYFYSTSESEALTNFGFEMFENRASGGRFETHSMEHLYEMWNILPQTTATWLIGDGLWTGSDGRYYKSVDLGYLRDIWYFGMIGTFFVFRYYYYSLKLIFKDKRLFEPFHKIGFLALFLFVLIVNAKGPGDLFLYVLPFYFCTSKGIYFDLRIKQVS